MGVGPFLGKLRVPPTPQPSVLYNRPTVFCPPIRWVSPDRPGSEVAFQVDVAGEKEDLETFPILFKRAFSHRLCFFVEGSCERSHAALPVRLNLRVPSVSSTKQLSLHPKER